MLDQIPQPEHSTVLVIGAHPDDAVLGAGALLARLALQGHRVVVLTLSSGELAGDPASREMEEAEAMRRLGADVVFGRLPDGRIGVNHAIAQIDLAVQRHKPSIALVHAASDTHQDHVAAFKAATVSCRKVASLLTYEGPSSLNFQPTITLDVTDTWECKMHALDAYGSQLNSRNLLHWATSAATFRAWPRHVGAVCEGFNVCHAQSLPMLSIPRGQVSATKDHQALGFGFDHGD